MRSAILAVIIVATTPVGATAQDNDRAAALARLTACRAEADAVRLACYDAAVAALDNAERTGEIVVLDRAQVREARRELFGFSVPSFPFTGGQARAEDEVDNVTFTITSVRALSEGVWLYTMEDGSVWRQLESLRGSSPRPGMTAIIRRAALGSFMMSVDGRVSVRVRREG